MNKNTLTFDQLPTAVFQLSEEVRELRRLLTDRPAATTTADEPALSVNQAAEVLGISRQTVYQNISKIPHTKRHGRLYFFRSQLLTYLNPEKQAA